MAASADQNGKGLCQLCIEINKGRLTTACSGGREAQLSWFPAMPRAAPLMRVR